MWGPWDSARARYSLPTDEHGKFLNPAFQSGDANVVTETPVRRTAQLKPEQPGVQALPLAISLTLSYFSPGISIPFTTAAFCFLTVSPITEIDLLQEAWMIGQTISYHLITCRPGKTAGPTGRNPGSPRKWAWASG